MNPVIEQIAKEYKTVLHNLYGNELAELVLFGLMPAATIMTNPILILP